MPTNREIDFDDIREPLVQFSVTVTKTQKKEIEKLSKKFKKSRAVICRTLLNYGILEMKARNKAVD